ncbi:dienelactone hydrolase [Dipodascopsis tothii]|uniref:dienelactone hydrolase n=1 Tax=Dipodascopsis tothii TaxID=44089 RepID=UPI0034CF7495
MSAASAPGPCCLTGVKHEGPVSGKMIDYHGTETYVTGDEKSKKIILILSDIFGHVLSNTQLIADQFAECGYYVVVPDLFEGDALPFLPFDQLGTVDLPAWLGKHTAEMVTPLTEKIVGHLKADFAPESIGAVGYCFGAKYVLRLMNAGLAQVGAIAHPSFCDNEEFDAVRQPLIIEAAETDPIFPTENRHKVEVMLAANKIPYQISVYSGVVHGFAVRTDLAVPQNKYAKEQAFLGMAAFFNNYL